MESESNAVGTNVYGDVCIRKVRRRRQKALVQEMLYDYATNTTLHGIPYTTRRGFTLVERIFWIATFITSILICTFLINNTWQKWKTSPVLVSISETLVPVGEVPFPSVTICPQLKIKKNKFDYAAEDKRLQNISNELDLEQVLENFSAFLKMDDLSLVCNDRRMLKQFLGGSYLHDLVSFFKSYIIETNTSVIDEIIEVAPRVEDIFVTCKWRGQIDDGCLQTMSEVITSEGLCFNINSLPAHDILSQVNSTFYFKATEEVKNWSMNEGYTSFGRDVYPVAGKALDSSPDLEIIFQDKLEDHGEGCDTINHGFLKVFIQHPADLPQSSLYYYAVRNGEVSSMALSFNKMNTAESVRNYPIEIRQCYFPEEYKLKYFKIYTASNCMLECLTNITYEKCGCFGFYMLHYNQSESCGFDDYECMYAAREDFVYSEVHKNNKTCRCLPPCHSIEYQAEILKTGFDFQNFLTHYNRYNITFNKNISYSKLDMFYKGPRFVSMHRSELFGTTDFMANIGGLLGLFLGFSFLSLIELFYYLTLRLCCVLKKDLKQEKIHRSDAVKTETWKY